MCRYYHSKMRKAPHVVGHYAAGARLIGLTEKQIAKRLATLSASGGKDNDSPYAQPLCLFNTDIPASVFSRERKTHGKIRLVIRKVTDEDKTESDQREEGAESRGSHEGPLPDVSTDTISLYLQSDSPFV